MELKLKQDCLDAYETDGEVTLTQEASEETIVPDYCPDVERILSAQGKIFLHDRSAERGEVEGSVRICVLYAPEGGESVRSLDLSIPFTAKNEGQGDEACAYLDAETELAELDARLINPRKIYTHCKLLTHMRGYRKTCLPVASEAEADEGMCVEQQTCTETVSLLTKIADGEFTYSGTLSLSPSKAGAEEVLMQRVEPSVQETRVIGSKLAFKGVFQVDLLYRSPDGMISAQSAELPFSQIMEIEDGAEDAQVSVHADVTGVDIQIDRAEDEGRMIPVTIYYHVFALLRQSREVAFLTDLYSTAYPTEYHAIPLTVESRCERICRREAVRETLEVGAVESVVSVSADCGCPAVCREGEEIVLRTGVTLRAIYRDGSGACLSTQRRIEVSTSLDAPQKSVVLSSHDSCSGMQWTLGERGIEVRLAVDLCVETCVREEMTCISDASIDEGHAKDLRAAPSLVLRCFDGGTLWDTAKRYNSTAAEILRANALSSEAEIPTDKLLLIPRKRA